MEINKERVIQELNLKSFGGKGWMNSELTKCPVCGRSDKFGILFTETGGVTHCFYACSDNLSLYKYLKEIGRDDLISHEKSYSIAKKLIEPKFKKEQEEIELPEIELPKGFERINYDKYLSERNFRSWQYDLFEVGITNHFLEKKLHNYLIFILKQNGKRVGWLARSKYSKEWHKRNLEQFKLGKERLTLRYRNSDDTDFDSIIGGFDQITENTHTLILVEGIFDSTNISNLIRTNESEEVKVVFTFGDSVSDNQIKKIKNEKNVKNIILLYDYNTIRQSKHFSLLLSKWFNVDVCYIDREGVDPGNIDEKYLSEVLSNKKNFLYFYNSKFNIKL